MHLPQRRRQSRRHDLDALHVQHAGLPRLSEIRRLARRVLRRRQRRSCGVRARSRRDAGGSQRDAATQVGGAPQRPRLPDGAAGHRVRHDAAAGRRARPLHPRQRRRAQQSGQQRSDPRFPRALHADGRLGHADEHDAERTCAGARRRVRFGVPDPERLRCDPSARHIAVARSADGSADGADHVPQLRHVRKHDRQSRDAPAGRHDEQHRRRALVRAAPHRRRREPVGALPARHLRAGRHRRPDQPLDGRDRDG